MKKKVSRKSLGIIVTVLVIGLIIAISGCTSLIPMAGFPKLSNNEWRDIIENIRKDTSLCKNYYTDDINGKIRCLYNTAKITEDSGLCEKMPYGSEVSKESCYKLIAKDWKH